MYIENNTDRSSVLCNFAQHSPTKATGVLSLLLGALWRVASPIFSRPIPLSILICGVFWAALSTPVWAQNACGLRTDIPKHLSSNYEEAPTAIGLANNGALVELLTADNGKTWTLLITDRRGESCLIAAGENWETVIRRLGNPA